jgi:hypothetical protein
MYFYLTIMEILLDLFLIHKTLISVNDLLNQTPFFYIKNKDVRILYEPYLIFTSFCQSNADSLKGREISLISHNLVWNKNSCDFIY